ncbi:amidohydrolase family protein [Prosthecomicrobium sp. N25]|uniref:amidohydrolase family protein n=1 Tax=Prosthecomicrobium sp. N25 TaxID=3129254 RepID=UPI0030780F14
MLIDTHVHVWQPGDGHRVLIRERMSSLDADFGFERLEPELRPAGVGTVILVSAAQSYQETRRLIGVAERWPDHVAGVIGFLDMEAEDFGQQLAAACRDRVLAGLRLPLVVFDDPDWIRRPRVGAGLEALAARGLVAQVLAAPVHLAACADVLGRYPDLKIVIDHAGNPGPLHREDPVWREGLAALGRLPGAFCKVGDFSPPAGPRADEHRRAAVLREVAACFGESRLIFGSNWPVCRLQYRYSEVVAELSATAEHIGLDPARLQRAMTANAKHLYANSHPPGR